MFYSGRQMDMMQNMQPIQHSAAQRPPNIPVQPQILPRGRKKKKPLPNLQLPIVGRRDFGFTKDRIKSLISQDGDIRKILKDLVRVTMQKVDLLDMIQKRQSMQNYVPNPDDSMSQEF